MTAPQGIELLIPGPWPDRAALLAAIIESSNTTALAAGGILLDRQSQRHAAFAVHDADPALADAMWRGSGKTLAEPTLAAIRSHSLIAGLTIDPSPSLAADLALFTTILREAGGLAVKIEYSGVSHDWPRWQNLLQSGEPASLYWALMVHVPFYGRLTSFGMRQFGLPDATAPDDDEASAYLLRSFNIYQWTEKPHLQSGHTFSASSEAPRYRLHLSDDDRYAPGEIYHNPNGLWRLTDI